jgi:hypothetical protein
MERLSDAKNSREAMKKKTEDTVREVKRDQPLTVRELYNSIRREFPFGVTFLSKVAEAKRSLSRVEQQQLLQLLYPDLKAFGAVLIGKAPHAVPSKRKKAGRDAARFSARLAAQDLKGGSKVIAENAERGDKQRPSDILLQEHCDHLNNQ